MPNLFIDLDGTLIDSRQRQYALFTELAPQCNLSFEEYWTIKRKRINQETMLRQYAGITDTNAIRAFHAQWMEKIEEPLRLLEDSVLPDSDAFLTYAAKYFTLYIVTARQYPSRVSEQILRLGWAHYFKALLVTGQRQSKASLIRTVPHTASDVLIGDTGEDVIAAREAGIRSVAVCTGILNAQVLKEYKPDMLVTDLMALIDDTAGSVFLGNE